MPLKLSLSFVEKLEIVGLSLSLGTLASHEINEFFLFYLFIHSFSVSMLPPIA